MSLPLPVLLCFLLGSPLDDVTKTVSPPTDPPSSEVKLEVPDIRRIFVAPLVGDRADEMREMIIASLSATKLFVLTENQERADAILKGAANDKTFTDTLDSDESVNARQNGGGYSSVGQYGRQGIYGGLSAGGRESTHIKERKHETYAAVRLCDRDGDVIWSTTQESRGAKFRGAEADVAEKVARQLSIDWSHVRGRMETPKTPPVPAEAPPLSAPAKDAP